MSQDIRYQQLKQIRDEIVNLTSSPLYQYRVENNHYPVIGQGNHYAKVMLIGEAPSSYDAKSARPFSGPAGDVLDQLLTSVGLTREDVYITNVLKDYPPENRNPRKAEIDIYLPFLKRQINIVQPEIIITSGRFAMEVVLDYFQVVVDESKISDLHGTIIRTQAPYGEIVILPQYNPAYALHREEQRETIFEDFEVVGMFIDS